MIPGNTFTPTPQFSSFLPPLDEPYVPLSHTVMGGNAINDPSGGRLVKRWVGYYDGNAIRVKPEGDVDVFSMVVAGVKTVALAFDNNMSIVLCWQTLAGSNLYYYDTLTATYVTRPFAGTDSCRVCVDDARDFFTSASDVIFAYTLGGNLYWRQQRDRYDIERLVAPTPNRLIKVGPSAGTRLQFELVF